MKAKISEIFLSFQGEGKYTGRPSVWIRFFGCSLECNGFGQEQPTNPDTWDLPYKEVNISLIKKLEDLPVFNKGCDSSYSWSNKYKNLVPSYTIEELYDVVKNILPQDSYKYDLCFTGGEPMLWQNFMIGFLKYCETKETKFRRIQIETSGYNKDKKMLKYIQDSKIECFWSISPKLYNVSGEKEGVNVQNIVEIIEKSFGKNYQLKFVMNNKDESWIELKDVIINIESAFKSLYGIELEENVYIMPVGATLESQTGTTNSDLSIIANKAISLGYNVSGRLHANIYGNKMGT